MSQLFETYSLGPALVLELRQGDLTREDTDAIVNAANASLAHGGGVAGAISRAGGPVIQRESDDWVRQHGRVRHDQPAYTSAGNLPCKYVIHAVGPVWGEGDEQSKLASAVTGSLALADTLHLESIALPAISTGIFGFPIDLAARVILKAILAYPSSHPQSQLKSIRMVLYDASALEIFRSAAKEIFPKP